MITQQEATCRAPCADKLYSTNRSEYYLGPIGQSNIPNPEQLKRNLLEVSHSLSGYYDMKLICVASQTPLSLTVVLTFFL